MWDMGALKISRHATLCFAELVVRGAGSDLCRVSGSSQMVDMATDDGVRVPCWHSLAFGGSGHREPIEQSKEVAGFLDGVTRRN